MSLIRILLVQYICHCKRNIITTLIVRNLIEQVGLLLAFYLCLKCLCEISLIWRRSWDIIKAPFIVIYWGPILHDEVVSKLREIRCYYVPIFRVFVYQKLKFDYTFSIALVFNIPSDNLLTFIESNRTYNNLIHTLPNNSIETLNWGPHWFINIIVFPRHHIIRIKSTRIHFQVW